MELYIGIAGALVMITGLFLYEKGGRFKWTFIWGLWGGTSPAGKLCCVLGAAAIFFAFQQYKPPYAPPPNYFLGRIEACEEGTGVLKVSYDGDGGVQETARILFVGEKFLRAPGLKAFVDDKFPPGTPIWVSVESVVRGDLQSGDKNVRFGRAITLDGIYIGSEAEKAVKR